VRTTPVQTGLFRSAAVISVSAPSVLPQRTVPDIKDKSFALEAYVVMLANGGNDVRVTQGANRWLGVDGVDVCLAVCCSSSHRNSRSVGSETRCRIRPMSIGRTVVRA